MTTGEAPITAPPKTQATTTVITAQPGVAPDAGLPHRGADHRHKPGARRVRSL